MRCVCERGAREMSAVSRWVSEQRRESMSGHDSAPGTVNCVPVLRGLWLCPGGMPLLHLHA